MAITNVQTAGAQGSDPSQAVTFSAATVGNLLVLGARTSMTTTGAVTGPAGWTQAVVQADSSGSGPTEGIWYKVAAGGETSATIAISSAGGIAIEMGEFTGVATWALDKTATNDPAGAGTTCATGSTGTLTQAAEIAFALVGVNTTTSGESWDSSFTLVRHQGNGSVVGYLITAATTALNPTATWTGSNQRSGVIATFMSATVTVDSDLDLRWQLSGVVDSDLDLRWKTGGTVDSDLDLRWRLAGPVGAFTVRTEVALALDPLVRPTTPDWSLLTAVSDGITNLNIKRGTKLRSAGLETGTASVRADNSTRQLDPSNTASAWYPNVKPRKRLRHVVTIGGTDYVLHTGFIERLPIEWGVETGWVTITTSDLFGLLAGATLPPSVLDVVTRELGATNYWPMAETVFTFSADDVIGSNDGVYIGAVQSGEQVVPFDPRPCPKFPRPLVDNQPAPAMVVNPISCPSSYTISFWFKWDVSGSVTFNPTLVMFQDTNPPDIPSGVFTTPKEIALYLVADSTFTDRKNFRVAITDGTSQARVTAAVAFNLMDGNPHHVVWKVNTATKAISVTCDDLFVSLSADTGDPGTTPIASVNVATVASAMTTLSAGWGIDFQTVGTTQNSCELGQVALWNRILSLTEATEVYEAGTVAWDGDTTDERLERILDLIDVDALDRDIAVGTQTCGPTVLGSQNALGYIRKINATEGGACFVSGDGKVTFLARNDSPTVGQVFSDKPSTDGGVPYGPIKPDYSYDRINNTVTIGRENGADQLVTNDPSIAAYGPLSGATGGKLDTLAQNAADARTTGARLVTNYGDPHTYIPSVEINAVDRGVDLTAMTGVEIGDAVEVFARPAGGGAAIDQTALIEALEHKFPRSGVWTVAYSLVEYEP